MMRLLELLLRRNSGAAAPRLGLALNSPTLLRAGCWLHARPALMGRLGSFNKSSLDVYPFHGGVATASARGERSVASLLTRQFLRDGEVILLIIKPSLWYVALSSMRFAAAVLIALIGAHLWLHQQTRYMVEAGVLILAARLMWALLAWMGRLYVLTDQRVLRISGVIGVEIFDCALRRVARTRVTANVVDRLLGIGSIEIIPDEEDRGCGYWIAVKSPIEVNHQIVSAIKRARSGTGGCDAL